MIYNKYDAWGNIAKKWAYDGKDRVATYSDHKLDRKHIYDYDMLGRFVREAVVDTNDNSRIYSSEYGYDSNNNVNKIGVVADNVSVSMSYTYGTDNLPSGYSSTVSSGTYTYDKLNRLSAKTSSITPTVTYEYNNGTAMVNKESVNGVNTTYAYDENGNIIAKGSNGNLYAYHYDEFNRLYIERNGELNQTTTYKYDAWGNIAKKWVYSGWQTASPSADNLIKECDYVYSSSTEGMEWKDLLTEYDGKTITYDAIGNPTSYMGSTMYWEGRTLVEQIKDGTTITYSYDASDMRTSKTVGGVKHNYYYVEGKLMVEECPSYTLFYTYDASGFLSGIRRIKSNGTTENFGVHCNMFGDVISIYYSDGMLAATYSYDSWGKLLAVTDMTGSDVMGDNDIWTQNSIRYRGYVYDEETQLYYLQSRYYDPDTCRFINADNFDVLASSPATVSEKNLFSYCDCNPLSRCDYTGQEFITIATTIGIMLVGGVIGASISAASSYITQKIVDNNVNWKSVAVSAGSGFISGAVGASPLGATGQAIVGAITNGASYVVDSSINNDDVNLAILLSSIITGGVFGKISGGGANENLVITNSINAARKALSKASRRLLTNSNYANKSIQSWTNYLSNDLSIEIWKFSAEYTASDIATNVVNNTTTTISNVVEIYLQLKKLLAVF